jgi:SAM-dependent methyltransferase
MTDYDTTFTKRGRDYKYATDTYPMALQNEFKTAASIIVSENHNTVLNIPAACVPLHLYLPSTITYIPYESNKDFAAITNTPYASLFEIPVQDNSIDAIVSLASLHHTTHSERIMFYEECFRILRPHGRLIIGDVVKDSPQAEWLNVFVNKYNPSGHNGLFWSVDDCDLMKTAGFDVDFSLHSYTWDFDSHTDMVDFSRHLFGLENVSDAIIKDGLRDYLHVECDSNYIKWKLGYFVGRKLPKLA